MDETNRAKLDQTCLAALIIQRVQPAIAAGGRVGGGARGKLHAPRKRGLLSVHLHTWRPLLPSDVSLSVPLPPHPPTLDFSSSSSPSPRFPSIWKLFRAVEDGENWPISLADRSLSELVEFRANFSGWDVPGILEYFSSFFGSLDSKLDNFFLPLSRTSSLDYIGG